ncbi:MAG: 50S ribosomal protein L11 methyltransferase [Bacteroidales bacterium]|nr:50S ribosomal protein L11 methyltransferase [Bacteroidales bacterium]
MHTSVAITLHPDTPEFREMLIAQLDIHGFEGVFEEDERIIAYIPALQLDESALMELERDMQYLGCTPGFFREDIEEQNWNSVWEQNFEPVVIEGLCAVRAPFHDRFPDVQHEITIEPKMSFGTGHHQTTRLIMQELFNLDVRNKKVLDMGCGTGVLAILALKLGASSLTAIDIDDWAYENTLENIARNDCPGIEVKKGSVEAIPEVEYELILANINRNILLEQIPVYVLHMAPKASLVLSGILVEDEAIIRKRASEFNLEFVSSNTLDKWMMLIFQRN